MLCGIWAVNQTSRGRYLTKKPARQHNGKVYEAILRPLKLYGVAVLVFCPDTNLHLPHFLFKYALECMVSWLKRSKICPHLTLQVAAQLSIHSSIHSSICSSIHLSIYPSIRLSICSSICHTLLFFVFLQSLSSLLLPK